MKPQTSNLVVGKLKRKVRREPVGVALHGKIQRFGRNPVEFGQVGIEHDLLTANQKYSPLDLNCQRIGIHRSVRRPPRPFDLPDWNIKLSVSFSVSWNMKSPGNR